MNERELFLSALEIEDPPARRAHLESACAGDVALLARVEALLASHESESRFLNTPVVEQIRKDSARGTETTILLGNGSTHDEEPDAATPGSNGSQSMPENRGDLSDEVPLKYLQPTSKTDSIGRLAHYEVLEVVGRGAFGTVLRAFDEKLRRVVAIKVLSPEMAATSPARKRFLREARSSAAVRHRNVVSIYAVEDDPIPYLVMDYIPGQTLQQRLDEHGPLDLPDVLRLGKQIADGLAAAHAEGLIHRDIKPGNILLETGLVDHVRITDFGLARTADDASMTRSGVIAGTPMYMAPEQALGRKLDQRADLFSFGSVLYQMLCGHPPFRAPTTMAVLKRVAKDTPRPIQEIIPEVPDWMCRLVGHLLAKNPDHRYGTAKEVSDLLAQCLADVQAGRKPRITAPSRPADDPARKQSEKVRPRSVRRIFRRPLAAAAAVVLLMMVGLGITEVTGITQLTTRNGRTVVPMSLETAPAIAPFDAEEDGSRAKLPFLKRTLLGHLGGVRTVVYSPDGRLLASGGAGDVRVCDAETGELLYDLPVDKAATFFSVAFSPDSKYIVTAPGQPGPSDTKTDTAEYPIRIWEASTGKPAGILEGHTQGLFQLSFSPDGKTLISCGYEHFLRIWDFAARHKLRDIPSPSDSWARSAVFSSTGQIAFGYDKVHIVEPDGRLVRTIEKAAGPLCFSPDGRRLAGTTWGEGLVTIWNVETGEEVASWRAHDGLANGVAFSPDGKVLATAGGDGKVRLWDILTQRKLAELPHDGEAYAVAFSPDGLTLATTGLEDHLVKLWDVSTILAQRRQELAELEREMVRRARAITVFRSEPDGKAPVEPVAERLHSYDNPARKVTAATVWAWGSSGRPVTLLAQEVHDHGEAGMSWCYEFVALSAESFLVESEDGSWQSPPLSAALDFRPFPEAPAAADSASGRLTQMQALLKRLKGVEVIGHRIELLPLPNPLHRYTAPQDGIIDGGLFALAKGANPEVVVLIELQGSSPEDGQWRYALSRLSSATMSVSLDGSEIWTVGRAEESETGSYWIHTEATASSGVASPPPIQPIRWPVDAPPPAMAPFDAEQASEHQQQWAAYLETPVEYTNSIGMKFVLIPPGEFLMGSTPEEMEAALAAAGNDELWKIHIRSEAPRHKVVLTQPIYLGMHEVTQAQYQQVMGTNPSHFAATGAGKGAVANLDTRNHPVEMVRWSDAAEFCAKLSEQEGLKPFYSLSGGKMFMLTGTGYRLPTEAEWEFACRGGTTTRFWCGDRDEDLIQAGWFGSKAENRTHPVGELKPNPFGLFDVHCNVWEWVQDGWEPNYGRFANKPAVDPKGSPSARSPRVIRGGGWDHHLASSSRATDRRSALPSYRNYHIGFRVVMAVP